MSMRRELSGYTSYTTPREGKRWWELVGVILLIGVSVYQLSLDTLLTIRASSGEDIQKVKVIGKWEAWNKVYGVAKRKGTRMKQAKKEKNLKARQEAHERTLNSNSDTAKKFGGSGGFHKPGSVKK